MLNDKLMLDELTMEPGKYGFLPILDLVQKNNNKKQKKCKNKVRCIKIW